MERRDVLKSVAAGAALGAMPAWGSGQTAAPRGTAEHVIMIWLGGGMSGHDTLDPKRKGDPQKRKPGSYYDSIPTAVADVQVCEHLPRLAPLMERATIMRTINHNVIDEHAAATNFMHTGRPVSGTIAYPSIGSVVAHELGAVQAGAPPYVLIGYPNVTRGPGFLGAKDGYLYLTDTQRGPAGLSLPPNLSAERQLQRQNLLSQLRSAKAVEADQRIQDYADVVDQCQRLSGPEFASTFELSQESDDLRNRYGGEFGQRCLLSRRLIERGVRFIEVSHNLNFLNGAGWDVHNDGILQQHALIRELDIALSALITDLEERNLLEKTLIVTNTEFGRPPEFDSGGGRGHQGTAFSCLLAGGGLRHCGAYGTTDEMGKKIVEHPVSVADFFATIHAALGIDYAKSLYDGDRPVPITDMGEAVTALLPA